MLPSALRAVYVKENTPAAVPVMAVIAEVLKERTASSGPVLAKRLTAVEFWFRAKLVIPPMRVIPTEPSGVVVTTPVIGSVTDKLAVIVPPVMAEGV